jgi:hypothetical protein
MAIPESFLFNAPWMNFYGRCGSEDLLQAADWINTS